MSLFVLIGYRVLQHYLIIEVLAGMLGIIVRSMLTGIVLASRYSLVNLNDYK